jgi:lysozyme
MRRISQDNKEMVEEKRAFYLHQARLIKDSDIIPDEKERLLNSLSEGPAEKEAKFAMDKLAEMRPLMRMCKRIYARVFTFLIFLSVLSVNVVIVAQTGQFKEPWKDSTKAIILDPYQENPINWDLLATDQRVVAIIHQATKGSSKDWEYAARKSEAKKRGYKWGSYHLGLRGDPLKQADFYLATAKPEADEVMALDIESLDISKDMSIDDARQFINRVKEKTGRYPLLYGNDNVIREISRKFGRDQMFSKVLLWYARFLREIKDFPKGTWDTYTLWQFSSEVNCNKRMCPYRVPGTLPDMDINVYNGTIEELRMNWPFTGN